VETRLWPTVDHLDPPDLPRHGCNSDRDPTASGGPTVLANDRNGGTWRPDQRDPVFTYGRCARRRTGRYDARTAAEIEPSTILRVQVSSCILEVQIYSSPMPLMAKKARLLQQVDAQSNLGVTIRNDLKASNQCVKSCAKASRVLG